MAFTETLSDFLDVESGFAISVTVDGTAIDAIFENAYAEVTIGNAPVSGVYPTIHCRDADVAGKELTTAVVESVNYTIIDIQPDGTGMSTCILTKQ